MPVRKNIGYVAVAIALSVVPLAGCDAAQDKLSAADACGDLIEMSLKELREVQENLSDPGQVAKSYRDVARRFEEKVESVDDTDVQRAVEKYTKRVRKLARQVENGGTPDLDSLVRANSDLAQACV